MPYIICGIIIIISVFITWFICWKRPKGKIEKINTEIKAENEKLAAAFE